MKYLCLCWSLALLTTATYALPFEIAVTAGTSYFKDDFRATVNPINPLPGSYVRDVSYRMTGRYFGTLEVRNTSLPVFRPFLGFSYYRSSFGSSVLSSRGYLVLAGAGAHLNLGFCGASLLAGAGYDLETYSFSDTLFGNASIKRNSPAYTAGLEISFPLVWRISTSLNYRFLSKSNKSDHWTVEPSIPNGRTDYNFTPSQKRNMLGFGFIVAL